MNTATKTRAGGAPAGNGDLLAFAKQITQGLETIKSIKAMPRKSHRPFASIGEQAIAIAAAERGGAADHRLIRAPAGTNVNDPSAGGFLVQADFVEDLVRSVYARAVLAPLCNIRETAHPLRETKLPATDEAGRNDGARNGGVLTYYEPEAVAPTKTFPKFRAVSFQPKKLISIARITNELLSDAPLLTTYLTDIYADELGFQIDRAVLLGTGSGTPTGVLNSPALITVPKEVGQAAATIVKENIDKMWSRIPGSSRRRAVWILNEDASAQLFALNQAVGTGAPFAFCPPGTVPGTSYGTLYGAPIIEAEQAPVLGSVGDITLCDLSAYTIVQSAATFTLSLHSGFDNDEVSLKVRMYVDGKSTQISPLTPYTGAVTKSPFVTLAAR
jgi:HK97 family phage major capsid protein